MMTIIGTLYPILLLAHCTLMKSTTDLSVSKISDVEKIAISAVPLSSAL